MKSKKKLIAENKKKIEVLEKLLDISKAWTLSDFVVEGKLESTISELTGNKKLSKDMSIAIRNRIVMGALADRL